MEEDIESAGEDEGKSGTREGKKRGGEMEEDTAVDLNLEAVREKMMKKTGAEET